MSLKRVVRRILEHLIYVAVLRKDRFLILGTITMIVSVAGKASGKMPFGVTMLLVAVTTVCFIMISLSRLTVPDAGDAEGNEQSK